MVRNIYPRNRPARLKSNRGAVVISSSVIELGIFKLRLRMCEHFKANVLREVLSEDELLSILQGADIQVRIFEQEYSSY